MKVASDGRALTSFTDWLHRPHTKGFGNERQRLPIQHLVKGLLEADKLNNNNNASSEGRDLKEERERRVRWEAASAGTKTALGFFTCGLLCLKINWSVTRVCSFEYNICSIFSKLIELLLIPITIVYYVIGTNILEEADLSKADILICSYLFL